MVGPIPTHSAQLRPSIRPLIPTMEDDRLRYDPKRSRELKNPPPQSDPYLITSYLGLNGDSCWTMQKIKD